MSRRRTHSGRLRRPEFGIAAPLRQTNYLPAQSGLSDEMLMEAFVGTERLPAQVFVIMLQCNVDLSPGPMQEKYLGDTADHTQRATVANMVWAGVEVTRNVEAASRTLDRIRTALFYAYVKPNLERGLIPDPRQLTAIGGQLLRMGVTAAKDRQLMAYRAAWNNGLLAMTRYNVYLSSSDRGMRKVSEHEFTGAFTATEFQQIQQRSQEAPDEQSRPGEPDPADIPD